MSTSNHINNKPIGFFDSGVGGLSVYSRFKKVLPNENTLYFGDLAHLPYGNKSKDELISYARAILDFYQSKQVKAVVIACNTSSAQAYEVVKNDYDFKIYPIIQSVAKSLAPKMKGKIGVFATQATVNSGVYTRELLRYNPYLEVKEIACPNWVEIVEEGNYNKDFAVDDVKKHCQEMEDFGADKIILGCTHYPYLFPVLEKFAPRDLFVDPAEIFVDFIKNDIELNQNCEGCEQIFVSAKPENFKMHSKIFYDIKELPHVINI